MDIKLIAVLLKLIIQSVFAQEVVFYPSQAVIKSLSYIDKVKDHKYVKRETRDKIKESNKTNDGEISWRHFNNHDVKDKNQNKRATDPVFHGHPKTREEMWNENFLSRKTTFDQNPSLIKLVHNITLRYLNDCIPVILYDSQVREKESYLFQNLLKGFPVTYIHGYISDENKLKDPRLIKPSTQCMHYIVFLTNVKMSAKILGKQSDSKVVIVSRSSQWAVQEFLASPSSRVFINLLVIAQSFKDDDVETLEAPYILYTHKLYTDGLGASQPRVLTSWSHGKYSRYVNLFPVKMRDGYAGHRFVIAAANQPPYVIRRVKTDHDGGNPRITWDGVEVRLLRLLADRNNFSIEIIEPQEPNLGPGDAVAKEITMARADIGIAGMYMTSERAKEMDLTFPHSQDCAAFITLTSTALPRYRAILGPFHWHVWVALTFTYLFGIFPLAFSDKHTLRHLLHNCGEVENMFWYVFGTFTNCFTFVGKNSWSKTNKITTRLLIGWYWLFTIIITSCYTGSIIAFVTLPMFPQTIDTIQQLLDGFYRIGTLDRGGWERWFFNSSDPKTNKLLKKVELLPNVEAGIRNTTRAFFWPYAFLGSQAQLEYIVQTNFTAVTKKRSLLHISSQCFVPFGVIMGFPVNSLYSKKLSGDVRRMLQSGIIDKLIDEVRWEIQRSSSGGLLAASSTGGSLRSVSAEEKGLTLADTQGMFLLLAAGFLMAGAALISEWMGGVNEFCRLKRKRDREDKEHRKEEQLEQPTANSTENLISNEAINRSESRLHFSTRSTSASSRDTLVGEVINITEENILVHNNFDNDSWTRRSSSVDLDKEVREIFEKDQKRRMLEDGVVEVGNEDSGSNGTFGSHLKSMENDKAD